MPTCDFIIRGAKVYDGEAAPPVTADVAVDRDRIVGVGRCDEWNADVTVPGQGKRLAPGFIDVHTHDDLAVFRQPEVPFKLSQGVTTAVAGNCGISAAPLDAGGDPPAPFPLLGETGEFVFPSVAGYRERFERHPPALNVALLAGHSSLRLGAMAGELDHAADARQLEHMQSALRTALGEGAMGLSTGLDYPPAAAAPADEVVALAKVLAEFPGAVYATHIRDEGDGVMDAVTETLDTQKRAGVPVVISHHKCAGPKNYGRSRETLAAIDAANRDGAGVTFDVYPYTASATSLLPQFVADAEAVLVAESRPHPRFNGWMLDDVARELGCDAAEAAEKLYPAAAIYFQISDDDLERIMAHPCAMIGSDGISNMGRPHPRLWGTFPRVLGHYSRKKRLFNMHTAIHKMTGLPARTFAIPGRGRIAEGCFADLVLFDENAILDAADFDHPERPATGIQCVWVNGEVAWRDGHPGPGRPGRFLAR